MDIWVNRSRRRATLRLGKFNDKVLLHGSRQPISPSTQAILPPGRASNPVLDPPGSATVYRAIDIPVHCFQLSFVSNPAWNSFHAKATKILNYWKRVAEKQDYRKYMKWGH
ncbi:MAG: hypothetical protein Q9175_003824 [Cornicularia normoerica]